MVILRNLIFICLLGFFLPVYGEEIENRNFWLSRYLSVSPPLKHIKITSEYGVRKDPFTKKRSVHSGLDLAASYANVFAMFSGVIEHIGHDSRSGNYITLRHGLYTVSYCHLSRSYVSIGDSVYAGDPVGITGNSGRTTGPHLHISCKRNGKYVNPKTLLSYIDKVREECCQVLGLSSSSPLSPDDFIRKYSPLAMEHQRLYGIPSSVILSQMALESDWGTSSLALEGKNFFGIKASQQWVMSGKPFSRHDDDRKSERFCNYSSARECMLHHAKILTSDRYKKYCAYSDTDYHGWLRGIKQAGYATAPDYVAKCEKIIRQYKLYRYDRLAKNIS